jgi:hypothetical protein
VKPPSPADLVKFRECHETEMVSQDGGSEPEDCALLICGLAENHAGDLHFDPVDHIWWAGCHD